MISIEAGASDRMISLLCKKDSETFIVTIDGKVIRYWDHKDGGLWGGYLQWLPECPQENAKKIILGRNKIPAHFIAMLKVGEDELAEWNACNNESEVYDVVIKDLKKNACKVLKETKT